ncbi:hypothetical protein [Nocardia altamirensis]|uniref:hypothetical protein n=1 Tax=Nocardia altamirensis TaxID=472158 RepID=UPI00083FE8F7|nr:hypothetical protein [Nocardia altamirensis]
MVIDKSGQWWRGEDLTDLAEFVRAFRANGYKVDRVLESVCAQCDGRAFRVEADDDEGAARRTCTGCGTASFIADSAEYWDDADHGECACPCGGMEFAVAVGYALRDNGDIRWISVGLRCIADGTLGVYADWKIDYSPALDLPA